MDSSYGDMDVLPMDSAPNSRCQSGFQENLCSLDVLHMTSWCSYLGHGRIRVGSCYVRSIWSYYVCLYWLAKFAVAFDLLSGSSALQWNQYQAAIVWYHRVMFGLLFNFPQPLLDPLLLACHHSEAIRQPQGNRDGLHPTVGISPHLGWRIPVRAKVCTAHEVHAIIKSRSLPGAGPAEVARVCKGSVLRRLNMCLHASLLLCFTHI